jgi:hypothetical protein
MAESDAMVSPQITKTRSAGADLIVQMKKTFKMDESRYRDELCFPYYRGYLEGQLKMIRFVETVFRERGRRELAE